MRWDSWAQQTLEAGMDSALVLMSERAMARAGVTPIARYAGAAAVGVHPD